MSVLASYETSLSSNTFLINLHFYSVYNAGNSKFPDSQIQWDPVDQMKAPMEAQDKTWILKWKIAI